MGADTGLGVGCLLLWEMAVCLPSCSYKLVETESETLRAQDGGGVRYHAELREGICPVAHPLSPGL